MPEPKVGGWNGRADLLRSAPLLPPRRVRGGWAIQAGACGNPDLTRAAAEGPRQAPDQLRLGVPAQVAAPFGSTDLYSARLSHLSASAAENA